MFGLFKKKRVPQNALDEFIFAVYGNPPPEKSASVAEAVGLAHESLLMGQVSKADVDRVARELDAGPIPYSTHDLALSVALHFFKQPALVPTLSMAQLMARLQALEWFKQGKVVAPLMKSFEHVLYELYKP